MFPFCNTYRLYGRGEAGLCCDVDGVALGPVRLVERVEKSYFVRPAEDIIGALEAAFGVLPEGAGDNLVLKIVGIARSLNDGELTQAMLKALYLRLPEIAAGNLAKMNRVGKAKPRHRADVAGGYGPGAEQGAGCAFAGDSL